MNLRNISNLELYLEVLDQIKQTSIIFVAVKDTAGLALRQKDAEKLMELGFTKNPYRNHGKSYIGVLSEGNVVVNEMSKEDETIIKRGTIKNTDISYYIRSAVYNRENVCNIKVDGTEYAVNARGLNFVIYDLSTRMILDSCAFDTHAKSNKCIRKDERVKDLAFEQETALKKLTQQVAELSQQFRELSQKISTDHEKLTLLAWQIFNAKFEGPKEARKVFFRNMPAAEGNLRKLQEEGIALIRNFDKLCRENDVQYWMSYGTLLGAVRHGGFIPWDDDIDVCMIREEFEKLKKKTEDNPNFRCYNNFGVHGPDRRSMNHGYKFGFKSVATQCTLDIFIFDEAGMLNEEEIRAVNAIKKEMGDEASKSSINPGTKEKWNLRYREKETGYFVCEKIYNKYFEKYIDILKGTKGRNKSLIWAVDNLNLNWTRKRNVEYSLVFPLQEISFEGTSFYAPNKSEEYLNSIYGNMWDIPDDILTHSHFSIEITEERERVYQEIMKRFYCV